MKYLVLFLATPATLALHLLSCVIRETYYELWTDRWAWNLECYSYHKQKCRMQPSFWFLCNCGGLIGCLRVCRFGAKGTRHLSCSFKYGRPTKTRARTRKVLGVFFPVWCFFPIIVWWLSLLLLTEQPRTIHSSCKEDIGDRDFFYFPRSLRSWYYS